LSSPSTPYRAPAPPDPAPILATTGPDIPGHRITQIVGIVQGTVGAELALTAKQAANVHRETRRAALANLLIEARDLGSHAVIGLRFEATAQVIGAYGTAVRVQPI
jgi:uncharacterized protein YbjQ (UPF0145 family)